MTTETQNITQTILKAANGKWLTKAADVPDERRTFAKTVYLGAKDSAENWKEVTDAARTKCLKAAKEKFENK